MMTDKPNGDARADSFDPLGDFILESEWCKRARISKRTARRYRELGLPYMDWGGQKWIHRQGSKEFLAARVRRRGQPSRGSRHKR